MASAPEKNFQQWLLSLTTNLVNRQLTGVDYIVSLLTELPQHLGELPQDVAHRLQTLAAHKRNQQEENTPRRSTRGKRAPKRTLDQLLVAEDDGTIPRKKKASEGSSAPSGLKAPSAGELAKQAENLRIGFGRVLGGAILYFLKLFYHPHPPLADLKRLGVIQSLFTIMSDNPDDTMVAGSMVVLNYFIHLSPMKDITPLSADDLCSVLLERLDTHHNQIAIEAALMTRNLLCTTGRDKIINMGFIDALTKTIVANRENPVIVVACLRSLHGILYGETPPPNEEELQQLLSVLRNIIYKDDELMVYYAASALSCITMYEDKNITRHILTLNLHAAIVQLLDVNPRIKRVALLLLEDITYSADNDSQVFLALLAKPRLLELLNEVLVTSLRKTELMSAARTLCNLCTGNAEVINYLLDKQVFQTLLHLVLHFRDYEVKEVVCWALYFAVDNSSTQQMSQIAAFHGFFEVLGVGFMTFGDKDPHERELCIKMMTTLAKLLLLKIVKPKNDVKQLLSPLPLQALKDLGDSEVSYVNECANALLAGNFEEAIQKAAAAPPATPEDSAGKHTSSSSSGVQVGAEVEGGVSSSGGGVGGALTTVKRPLEVDSNEEDDF